jgi:uncharacterized phiE125 gp8 family phage protein
MGLVRTVAPAAEPVSVAEAKEHLRVDDTSNDTLIGVLIAAARESVEGMTGRALVTQTWRLTLDAFPCDTLIRLPRPNLLTVTSVAYVDENGDPQTWDSANYVVDTASLPGALRLAYDVDWPTTRTQPNAVTITYTAGYGLAAAVPSAIKAAVLLMVGDLFANREGQIVGTIVAANPTVAALLAPYVYREAV